MATDAVDSIMSERNLLAMMDSNFVCCLKYAVQDNDTLYLMYVCLLVGASGACIVHRSSV